jgi:acyl-CoA synthetase (AMP-forming)/AMP-acid ligase II
MLAEVLLKAGNAVPQRVALRFLDPKGEEKALTFAALDRRVRSIAEFLSRRVEAGAAVLLALPPGLDFLPAFLGCLHTRVLAVPVAAPLRASDRDRIEKIAANCNASFPDSAVKWSIRMMGAQRSSG